MAFSNDVEYAILIPTSVKKEAVALSRSAGRHHRRLYLHLFAAALYHLLKHHLTQLSSISIDQEYEGHEQTIKLMLLNLVRQSYPGYPAEAIAFRRIGKASRAHMRALAVYRGTTEADRVLTVQDLVEPIKRKK